VTIILAGVFSSWLAKGGDFLTILRKTRWIDIEWSSISWVSGSNANVFANPLSPFSNGEVGDEMFLGRSFLPRIRCRVNSNGNLIEKTGIRIPPGTPCGAGQVRNGKQGKGTFTKESIIENTYLLKISPIPSFPKRGIVPPFGKACLPVGRGGEEGFYKIMSLLLWTINNIVY
jgi:hypothetical protein